MGARTRWSNVEVVVIMVVLTIVGITTVPKFTKASTESKVSDLIEGLETMRVQLDLYRAQHENSLPDRKSVV